MPSDGVPAIAGRPNVLVAQKLATALHKPGFRQALDRSASGFRLIARGSPQFPESPFSEIELRSEHHPARIERRGVLAERSTHLLACRIKPGAGIDALETGMVEDVIELE